MSTLPVICGKSQDLLRFLMTPSPLLSYRAERKRSIFASPAPMNGMAPVVCYNRSREMRRQLLPSSCLMIGVPQEISCDQLTFS